LISKLLNELSPLYTNYTINIEKDLDKIPDAIPDVIPDNVVVPYNWALLKLFLVEERLKENSRM
jgi:hypothetical protein